MSRKLTENLGVLSGFGSGPCGEKPFRLAETPCSLQRCFFPTDEKTPLEEEVQEFRHRSDLELQHVKWNPYTPQFLIIIPASQLASFGVDVPLERICLNRMWQRMALKSMVIHSLTMPSFN